MADGLINYSDFCDNIDQVFGEGYLASDIIGNSKSTAVSLDRLRAVRISPRRRWT